MHTAHGIIYTIPMIHGTGITDGATDGHGGLGTAGMVAFGVTLTLTIGLTGDGGLAGMHRFMEWCTIAIPCLASSTRHVVTWRPTIVCVRQQ